MQRLDRALVELSQRGEPVGPDRLLERVERDMSGEPDLVVVALDPRRTAVQTKERRDIGESGRRRSRGPLIAAAVVAATIAVAGVALLANGAEDTTSPAPATQPPEPTSQALAVAEAQLVMEGFVSALRAGDVEAAQAFGTMEPEQDGFLHFLTALDITGLEFFDCAYRVSSATSWVHVSCQTTYGPSNYFQRLGATEPALFSTSIDGGLIVTNSTWLPTPQELAVESQFRAWAEETHPELADVMFNFSFYGIVFTEESGRTRMQLLDEYLASR